MLTDNQQKRIAGRCASALLEAIDAFPDLLAQSEPEQAASIVADLIKFQLSRPQESKPEKTLEQIISEVTQEDI